MPDRLKELQDQRALVEAQLAWLDREIELTRGARGFDPAPPAVQRPIVIQPPQNPAQAPQDEMAANIAAEEIMAEYQKETQSLHGNVKRGCLLYFFAALAALVLGVLALYLFRTKT